MRVHLCGVRGSTPAPGVEFVRYGGQTSCVALAHDAAAGPTLILDAGTGLRRVTALLGGRPFSGTILLTHLHWDHVHGLPFFAAGDRDGSCASLLLSAQPDGAPAVDVLARGMSPPHFPITPYGLRGAWSFGTIEPGPFKAEGFTVEAREIPHKGGRTFGYRVSDSHSTVAYLPDLCPTVLGPGPGGWGEYHQAALDLAASADLLIHDAFLLADELPAPSAVRPCRRRVHGGTWPPGHGMSCWPITNRNAPMTSSTRWRHDSRRDRPASPSAPRAEDSIYERARASCSRWRRAR